MVISPYWLSPIRHRKIINKTHSYQFITGNRYGHRDRQFASTRILPGQLDDAGSKTLAGAQLRKTHFINQGNTTGERFYKGVKILYPEIGFMEGQHLPSCAPPLVAII
jgi:hypothetical protein